MFYGQLHTSILHYHYRASFLRFASSLNNVRFVASVSISAHHSPPAANNFCVPFGLLRLRVCHTFCKEKKEAKRYAKPLRDTVLPHALRAFGSPPLQVHAAGLPLLTPSASFRHASPSVDKFATSAQLPFLAQGCFYLRQKKERIMVFLFSFFLPLFFVLATLSFWRGAGGEVFLIPL